MKKTSLILFVLLLFFCSAKIFSQDLPKKTIVEIWKEIIAHDSTDYILNNVEIVYEENYWKELNQIFDSHPVIKTSVMIGAMPITNIKVSYLIPGRIGSYPSFYFNNVTFEKQFAFWNVPNYTGLNCNNCIFKGAVTIKAPENDFHLEMNNCTYYSPLNAYLLSSTKGAIHLTHNIFSIDRHDANYMSTIEGNEFTSMNFCNNRLFSSHYDSCMFKFINSFNSILIDSCDFGIDLNLNNINITTNFAISNTKFSRVSMEDAVLPPSGGVAIDWKQLENTLCVLGIHFGPSLNDTLYWSEQKDSVYLAKTDLELSNFAKYEMLVASYYSLLQIYKSRGDMESANACYVEVKDLQTRRRGYLYKTNPTVNNFFLWKTNQFLRYFCDYGTNPSKSVVISFYVILLFGGFYFFFYSQWDRINKTYFLSRFKSLAKYLSSKTTLKELYHSANSREIGTYKEFRDELKVKKEEMPRYVSFLGHLLYRYSTTKFNLFSWMIGKLDVQKGLWKDLSGGKKFLTGSFIGVTILAFLIYAILIKSLSATMLSLNAFSTLGFGNIPVKGFSKYLTVVEGFLGWLLLSIFSVSLIAQMIQ